MEDIIETLRELPDSISYVYQSEKILSELISKPLSYILDRVKSALLFTEYFTKLQDVIKIYIKDIYKSTLEDLLKAFETRLKGLVKINERGHSISYKGNIKIDVYGYSKPVILDEDYKMAQPSDIESLILKTLGYKLYIDDEVHFPRWGN